MRCLLSILAASMLFTSACSSSSSPPGETADASTPATDSGSHDASTDASGDGPASSSDSAAPTEGGACTLHATTGKTACDTCVTAQCCTVANTCFDDTSGCAALLACVVQCKATDGGSDSDASDVNGCESDCANTYPGTQAASDLINCEASSACQPDCL